MSKKLIEFQNIVKEFDKNVVLKDINLSVDENEFLTLLGPSGCGKTTLLRILGGFLSQDQGKIIFDGEEISSLPANKRNVNTVFQRYALFPHMNVFENIAFGLKIKKEAKDVIVQKVRRMLKLVNLEDYENRRIQQLSGGQQQRVAIARALVNEPKVLLLDEPLAALDLKLRKEMQKELKKIQQEVGITFIYVTHDQEEALTMSDKIVVMNNGYIEQIGTPTDIYNEPVNTFVANFIGESNIVDGVMKEDFKVMIEDKIFDCVDAGFKENESVDVVIRPEDLDIVEYKKGKLNGVVKSVLFKGVHYQTIVETKKGTWIKVKMRVSEENPIINHDVKEKISANDFYVDIDDVLSLSSDDLIARSGAQAWNYETDEFISISKIDYQLVEEKGSYPITFATNKGTKVEVNMIVTSENRVVNKEYQEEIFAMDFFKTIDDIKESVAIDTDLKTWADAYALDLESKKDVEIQVSYNFDPDNITAGVYEVEFKTEGYEYVIDTTDYHPVDSLVGLDFEPQDIHIMRKEL